MKKTIIYVTLLAALFSVPSISMAKSSYMDEFTTLYPNSGSLSCSICHTSVPALNTTYGTAFKNNHPAGTTATAAIIKIGPLDSDGDGYTNRTEIMASTATVASNPAVKTSVPASLLLFDDFKAAGLTGWLNLAQTYNGNGNVMLYAPAAANFFVSNAASVKAVSAGTVSSKIQLSTAASKAYIIFSDLSASAYRYVYITPAATNNITIGQVGAVGTDPAGVKATGGSTAPGTTMHTYRVVLSSTGQVNVYVDTSTTPAASFKFATAVGGKVGVRGAGGNVSFDDFTVTK